jgi:hypothetical protein
MGHAARRRTDVPQGGERVADEKVLQGGLCDLWHDLLARMRPPLYDLPTVLPSMTLLWLIHASRRYQVMRSVVHSAVHKEDEENPERVEALRVARERRAYATTGNVGQRQRSGRRVACKRCLTLTLTLTLTLNPHPSHLWSSLTLTLTLNPHPHP